MARTDGAGGAVEEGEGVVGDGTDSIVTVVHLEALDVPVTDGVLVAAVAGPAAAAGVVVVGVRQRHHPVHVRAPQRRVVVHLHRRRAEARPRVVDLVRGSQVYLEVRQCPLRGG